MAKTSYYVRRNLGVVAGAAVGAVCASLWLAGCILIGSRLGELWAGDRRATA